MKLIGITGGVGAGKSEIISYLENKYNCRIEYADKVAHMLEEPGQVCFDKLVSLLGTGILKDGKIDKASMANAMFKDDTLVVVIFGHVCNRIKDIFVVVSCCSAVF